MSYEELSTLLPSVADAWIESLQDSEEWANIPTTLNPWSE